MRLGKALHRLPKDRSLASPHVHQDCLESLSLQPRFSMCAAPAPYCVSQSTGQALRIAVVESILVREGSDALRLDDFTLGINEAIHL